MDLSPLSHPSTLKLFLYAKSCYPNDFGVREAKRNDPKVQGPAGRPSEFNQ